MTLCQKEAFIPECRTIPSTTPHEKSFSLQVNKALLTRGTRSVLIKLETFSHVNMTCGPTADLLELVFIIKKIVLSITDKKNYVSFLNLKTNKQCRPRQYKSLARQPSKKGNPTQNSISEKRNNHYRRDVSCEGLEREQVGTKRGIQHNSHSSLMSPPMGMKPEWSVYVTMWTPLFDSSKLSPKMIFKGKYSYIISMCVCVCVCECVHLYLRGFCSLPLSPLCLIIL